MSTSIASTSLALNLFFPPRCGACASAVEQAHTLCEGCFASLHIITQPACALCGFPFEYEVGENALCGACLEKTPPYAKGWAALRYDEAARSLVAKLKYADKTHLAPYLGRLMAAQGQEVLEGADVLVPVPLHWRRMLTRRYNQSLLLARETSKASGIPLLPDALKRTRHTPPQASLSRKERLDNVRGAFTATRKGVAAMAGKTVVLVDDVMTTGATIYACCKTIRRAGAKEVRVLTLARRMRED